MFLLLLLLLELINALLMQLWELQTEPSRCRLNFTRVLNSIQNLSHRAPHKTGTRPCLICVFYLVDIMTLIIKIKFIISVTVPHEIVNSIHILNIIFYMLCQNFILLCAPVMVEKICFEVGHNAIIMASSTLFRAVKNFRLVSYYG